MCCPSRFAGAGGSDRPSRTTSKWLTEAAEAEDTHREQKPVFSPNWKKSRINALIQRNNKDDNDDNKTVTATNRGRPLAISEEREQRQLLKAIKLNTEAGEFLATAGSVYRHQSCPTDTFRDVRLIAFTWLEGAKRVCV